MTFVGRKEGRVETTHHNKVCHDYSDTDTTVICLLHSVGNLEQVGNKNMYKSIETFCLLIILL